MIVLIVTYLCNLQKSAQTQVDEPGTSSEESSDGTEVKVHRRQKTWVVQSVIRPRTRAKIVVKLVQ